MNEDLEQAYRRQIVQLTKDRNEARDERDQALANWGNEVQILRAQLAEGTSPRVEALRRELRRVQGQRDRAVSALSEARRAGVTA
ncbi:hypothetical protein [Dactylosporangium sp. CA-139066]|uniref:hypothetical protein n=1 Tax=Dactylosporangium sp. CA-139066 TaxID=3239930 RepID=UPI003D89BBB7